MAYYPGSSFTFQCIVDTDVTPTVVVTHNGADDGSVSTTVVRKAARRYTVSGTFPSTWASGDAVQVTASTPDGSGGSYYTTLFDGALDNAAGSGGVTLTVPKYTYSQAAALIAQGQGIAWKNKIYTNASDLPAEFV